MIKFFCVEFLREKTMEDAGSWKSKIYKKVMRCLLFYGPLRWISKIGRHIMDVQSEFLFGERITLARLLGFKKSPIMGGGGYACSDMQQQNQDHKCTSHHNARETLAFMPGRDSAAA